MNAAQVNGMTKNMLGKFQEKTGKFFGNKEQQMIGVQRQHLAKTEMDFGNAQELIKNAIKQMQRSKKAMNFRRFST